MSKNARGFNLSAEAPAPHRQSLTGGIQPFDGFGRYYTKYYLMAQWGAAAKAKNGGGVVKQTSQRSLLFRQNVNRTEEEWVHFLDGYRNPWGHTP